ncbi:MAG TPA: hypothetical protein VJQ49_08570 [Casimicrobiaceae bacterium]|nr:hypothetical protein [Casimicrobiaceae bacterium]
MTPIASQHVSAARFPRSIAIALILGSCVLAAPGRAQPAYSAAYISESVPSFIELLRPTTISVTMQNTGTATWYRADGDVFLATAEPQDNFYWCIQGNPYGSQSGNRVLLPYDVAPNQQVTFDFVVEPLGCRFSAPAPLRFRMLSEHFGTFGDETPDPQVSVSTASEFIGQQVPPAVPADAVVLVTETFKNTTLTTWKTTDGFTLRSADAAGGTTWSVTSVPLPADTAAGASVTFTFYITVPATVGSYNFQWQVSAPDGSPIGAASPATDVEVIAAGPPNYEGLWWNAPAGSEAGWGINLAHQGDTIFATWFTYDLTGKGLWLAMAASLDAAGAYSGTLFETTGPPFDSVPFSPSLVNGAAVGTGTLTFSDLDNGTFAYTVDGIAQTKSITREVFAQLPTCMFGILTDLTLAYNYQDLWWAAPAGSESGWGVNLTHQGDTIFATWFTYDLDGTPMWLVATAPKTALGVYSGTLFRTTGPPFDAVPFDPAAVAGTVVGTATFTFTDGNTGTFDYTVGGVTQSKAITREIFVSPGTVCQ